MVEASDEDCIDADSDDECTSTSSESSLNNSELSDLDSIGSIDNPQSDLEYQDDKTNTQLVHYTNCARLMMIFDKNNLIEDKRFQPLVQISENDICGEKAIYILRDHIVYGSYPFVGENFEGSETTREIVERQKRLSELFSGEIPTAAAYPSEIMVLMKLLKTVLNEIHDHLPKSGRNTHLSVKGPLKLSEYCTLNEQRYQNTKFQTKTKQPEPNIQVLPTPDLIVGFKGKYNVVVSADQLRFWERHKLEPPEGKKDITYLAIHPQNAPLRARVAAFFKHVNRAYKICELGTHYPQDLEVINERLIPVPLLETDTIQSYDNVCEKLGQTLAEIFRYKQKHGALNHIMIYFVNPFTHQTAYFDACKRFAKLQIHMKEHLEQMRLDPNLGDYVSLQIVPIDHIITFNINGGTHKQGFIDIAFSVYARATRPNHYVPPYMLPDPDPVAVHFKQSEDAQSSQDLIEGGLALHMAYGFTPDKRWLAVVFMDNTGNILYTSSLPLILSDIEVSHRLLFEDVWKRALELKSNLESCQQIIVCKLGSMLEEERAIWVDITESKMPILSVGLNPPFGPVEISHDDDAKVCGMVLNHPIPRIGFRPQASGYLLEVASDRGPLTTLEVDLLHKPNQEVASASSVLWRWLREFHKISHLDTTPFKNNCLPMHLLLVERLTRALLGVAL